jgi:hypothetical protein
MRVAKSVNSKLNEKLKDTYKPEQQRKYKSNLIIRVGTICQLMGNGVNADNVESAVSTDRIQHMRLSSGELRPVLHLVV